MVVVGSPSAFMACIEVGSVQDNVQGMDSLLLNMS